jgi:Flp pilus assembly pilin Flp
MLWIIEKWLKDESGLGTVEMVLILAVLVGIALIFREYIFGFVSDIMANIMGGDVDAIRNNPVTP